MRSACARGEPLISGNVGDLRDIAVRTIDLLFVPLKRLDHVAHGTRAEDSREHGDLAHAPTWTFRGGHLLTEAHELRLPDGGMSTLTRGDALEGAATRGIFLDFGEGVVQEDRVALER